MTLAIMVVFYGAGGLLLHPSSKMLQGWFAGTPRGIKVHGVPAP